LSLPIKWVFIFGITNYNNHIKNKYDAIILTVSLKHQLYRLLFLLSAPGVVVIVFTLLFNRNAAINESENKLIRSAKNLISQQKSMINDIEKLTLFLANKHYNINDLPSTCPLYFLDFQTLYGNIANMGVIDKKGNAICTTRGTNNSFNISDRRYFQNAVANKGFAIGFFQDDRSINTKSVNFAYPILDESNNVKGVVYASIALNWWNSALNNLKLPKKARAIIVDSNGLILANYPTSADRLGKKVTNDDFAHSQQASSIFKGKDGVKRIFHHSTIYNDNNNNLDIFITLPIDTTIEQVDIRFIKMLIAFIAAIIILTLLARHLINTSILNPIENLTIAVNSLASGNMPGSPEQLNSPELNILYQRFKFMAKTRLKAEASLKHKHDELNSLLNALPDTFFRIDSKGNILNVGGQIDLLSYLPPSPPKNLSCLLPQISSSKILSHIKNLKKPKIIEINDDQEQSFFEVQISPMQKPDEFIIVLRNINQRKNNEKSLHLAALVYSNSSEGMAITDKNGMIYDVNPAFSKTTLFSKKEVLNKTIGILSSGKHDRQFYADMWAALNSIGRWQGEIINRRKNGELYVEWLVIDTVYNEHKTPVSRIAIFTDLTEKKQADELIWKQAHFDHLTDLPNRLELKERLNKRFENITHNEKQLVIMLLDIDHFKDVNDTLGHHYGDNLLKIVSNRIALTAKKADFVARIGGDEFVIVFDDIKQTDTIKNVAQDLLLSLSSAILIDNETLFTSASIGIACAPADAQNPEQLLKAADQAMYRAKNNGRNGFEFFSKDMREHAQARMLILKELRNAIELEQFELFYQPIVSLNNLEIHKAEGLIRWHHPERGIISPTDFIPLAEETRQINALGQFVFAQALQTLNDIKKLTDDTFQISVNVSPVQLSSSDSGMDEWNTMLKTANISASSIVAEITEGLMVNPEALTQTRLKALVKSGMQLALDDFGTGYSSLAYLQEMDTHYLKIDKRFVDNIQKGSQELTLCETIIVMAHQLGLKVIAEGIETELQMRLLLEAGCDYGQGYLFSKPLSKGHFIALLLEQKKAAFK
jgi:diguanylate cyclase (GGDEF)-like protein/PAS domain S-box-containing protein